MNILREFVTYKESLLLQLTQQGSARIRYQVRYIRRRSPKTFLVKSLLVVTKDVNEAERVYSEEVESWLNLEEAEAEQQAEEEYEQEADEQARHDAEWEEICQFAPEHEEIIRSHCKGCPYCQADYYCQEQARLWSQARQAIDVAKKQAIAGDESKEVS